MVIIGGFHLPFTQVSLFYADTDRHIPHQQMKIYIPFQFCFIFYITYMTAIGMCHDVALGSLIVQKERRSGNRHF